MKKGIDLLNGHIATSLAKLAFPIMGTSLIQMAYNMTDMIWIGRVGSNAVAAVGAAGMYIWLSNGLVMIPRVGGQVKVAHALGAKRIDEARTYARGALQMGAVLGILFGILCVTCSKGLIGFFRLNSPRVVEDAMVYLAITGGCVIFSFINQVLAGIMTAMGNSGITFCATTVGLVVNIVLDPVLIFGLVGFPKMDVMGAAIATVLAQAIVGGIYLLIIAKDRMIFSQIHLFHKTNKQSLSEMIKIGMPVGIQNMIFTGISLIIARLIAGWGDAAVAVQKVGSQIESISWMTADGFAAAINSFIAQNYGADKKERIKKGYRTAIGIMAGWGVFTTLLLVVFPDYIFRIFITEPEVLPMGVSYLRILGYSQLFMCLEIASSGAFQGLGKTMPPTMVGIVLTSIRIPMAMILSATVLELDGIWWSITISSVLKGLVMPTWFIIVLRKCCKTKKNIK
ncbi:MAG: MATE family efflux transporter [Lachnospiraceae bacterium]